MFSIAITAVIAFIIDRISKIAIINYAFEDGIPSNFSVASDIPVIQDVFHIKYLANEGISWGMLSGKKALLIILCIVILAVIAFVIYKTRPENFFEKISYGLVMGGAIGNLADRFMYGFVVDFLDFRLINFPVFNVADCCVVVGAILLCICIIFFEKKEDEVGKD